MRYTDQQQDHESQITLAMVLSRVLMDVGCRAGLVGFATSVVASEYSIV
jgi:hypothetical protein